jgi:hypothetical protein
MLCSDRSAIVGLGAQERSVKLPQPGTYKTKLETYLDESTTLLEEPVRHRRSGQILVQP